MHSPCVLALCPALARFNAVTTTGIRICTPFPRTLTPPILPIAYISSVGIFCVKSGPDHLYFHALSTWVIHSAIYSCRHRVILAIRSLINGQVICLSSALILFFNLVNMFTFKNTPLILFVYLSGFYILLFSHWVNAFDLKVATDSSKRSHSPFPGQPPAGRPPAVSSPLEDSADLRQTFHAGPHRHGHSKECTFHRLKAKLRTPKKR